MEKDHPLNDTSNSLEDFSFSEDSDVIRRQNYQLDNSPNLPITYVTNFDSFSDRHKSITNDNLTLFIYLLCIFVHFYIL